jgi:glycosyltransferase involved in cell wall biosynthesis
VPSAELRPLKVLHVAETIRGGIATYINELHPHQRASLGSGNVHYVVPSDHRADLIGIEDAEITPFDRSGRGVAGLFRMLQVTMGAIRDMQPDVVHLHSSFAGLVLRPLLLIKPVGPRVVYCPHGWAFSRETGWLSHRITKFAENLLSRITDRIICISGDEFKEATRNGIKTDRLTLVHNGISTIRPQPDSDTDKWRSEKTKVLFIGRLDRQKGYDLLIEAARALEDVVDVHIVGASVISKYDGSGLPSNVSLLGWMDRNQIENQLEQADLVVIPSRWEAFGLVALEAMRAAKPIIAFRVGALPEIVEDRVTGVLCGPVSAGQLIQGFREILKLDLPAMGQRGHERFRQLYDIEKTHRVLHQVYTEIRRGEPIGPKQQQELQSEDELQSDLSNRL